MFHHIQSLHAVQAVAVMHRRTHRHHYNYMQAALKTSSSKVSKSKKNTVKVASAVSKSSEIVITAITSTMITKSKRESKNESKTKNESVINSEIESVDESTLIHSNSNIIRITSPQQLAEVTIKLYGVDDLESCVYLLDRYIGSKFKRSPQIKKFEHDKPHIAFNWLGRWIQTSHYPIDFKPYPILVPANISSKILPIDIVDMEGLRKDLELALLAIRKRSTIPTGKGKSKKDLHHLCIALSKEVTPYQYRKIISILQDLADDDHHNIIGDINNTIEELKSVSGVFADKLLPILRFLAIKLSEEQLESFEKWVNNRTILYNKLVDKFTSIASSNKSITSSSLSTDDTDDCEGIDRYDGDKRIDDPTSVRNSSFKIIPLSVLHELMTDSLSHKFSFLNNEICKASHVFVTSRVIAMKYDQRGVTFHYLANAVVPSPIFNNNICFFDVVANMGSTDTNSTTVVQGGGGGGESKDVVVVDGGVSGDGSVKVHQLDDDDRALKLGDKIDRDIYNRMKRFESLQYNVKESTSLTIPSIEQLPVVATSEYLTLESIERRVVIFNLPPDITEEKLTQALRKCGVISRVWLFRETREVKASLKVKETREEEKGDAEEETTTTTEAEKGENKKTDATTTATTNEDDEEDDDEEEDDDDDADEDDEQVKRDKDMVHFVEQHFKFNPSKVEVGAGPAKKKTAVKTTAKLMKEVRVMMMMMMLMLMLMLMMKIIIINPSIHKSSLFASSPITRPSRRQITMHFCRWKMSYPTRLSPMML